MVNKGKEECFNLASTQIVYLSGISLIQKLGLHRLLLCLKQKLSYLSQSYLSQVRVGLSKLNFHKFKHNFRDAINPLCPTNDGIEDTEHFLLLCPAFDTQ